jgi:hypothetical protein
VKRTGLPFPLRILRSLRQSFRVKTQVCTYTFGGERETVGNHSFSRICRDGWRDHDPFISIEAGGITAASGVVNATTPGVTTGGGYTLSSATVCFDPYCTTTPGNGPDYTVNDPLTLRGTGLTLTCTQATCAAVNIFFDANWETVTPGVGTTFPAVTEAIDGTAPAGFSFLLAGNASSCGDTCDSLTIPTQTITANGSGMFSSSFNLGSFMLVGSSLKADLELQISGLTSGQSLVLPNSATLTFGNTSGVPEPATIGLIAAGLGGLAFLARKRRA